MSGPPDYFTDLVLEGEPVLATLAGAGADGKSWIHVFPSGPGPASVASTASPSRIRSVK